MSVLKTIFLLTGFIFCSLSSAFAGNCIQQETKKIIGGSEVTDNPTYLCKSDDGSALFKVQYQELGSDIASIILSPAGGDLSKSTWGNHVILRNNVWNEIKLLINKFGTLNTLSHIDVSKETLEKIKFKKNKEYEYYSLPDWPEFSLIEEHLHILTKDTWPKSLNLMYSEGSETWQYFKYFEKKDLKPITFPFKDTTYWRYIDQTDVVNYGKNISLYEKSFNKLALNKSTLVEDADSLPSKIDFLKYLAFEGLPDGFLFVEGGINSIHSLILDSWLCDTLYIRTYGPQLRIKIAIIENLSTNKILINDIFGNIDSQRKLREISTQENIGKVLKSLINSKISLSGKKKLIIPLNISFPHDSELPSIAEQKNWAKPIWQKLKSYPSNKIFKIDIDPGLHEGEQVVKTFTISKRNDSFKAPSFPQPRGFGFGPRWAIRGFAINNEKYDLISGAPSSESRDEIASDSDNIIELTYASGAGSCPILYAWRPEHNQWLRHGKVLHKAQSKALKQSETITYQGWVNKFRLSEEELEASFIDEVHLEVSLKRGQTLSLRPKNSHLKKEDQKTVDIYANEFIEFDFDLPPSVKEPDVLKSKLIVTGYYERYSTMLVRALAQESSK